MSIGGPIAPTVLEAPAAVKSTVVASTSPLSSSAKAEAPVRRGFSLQSLTSLEYWIARLNRAMTTAQNRWAAAYGSRLKAGTTGANYSPHSRAILASAQPSQ